jgi:membrane protease subunit HflK
MKPPVDTHAPPIVQAFDTAFRYLRWLALLLAVLYLASGITAVQPDEEAIVLTLGKVTQRRSSGLLLRWPDPIDQVLRVPTRKAQVLDTDRALWHSLDLTGATVQDPLSPQYVAAQEFVPDRIDPEREGYCIAGDKDIFQARVMVKYHVGDAEQYMLKQADPQALLRSVTLAATTRAIGELSGGDVLAMRGLLAGRIRALVQERLDEVQSGITVEAVELTQLHPPRHVLRAYQAVYVAKIEAANKQEAAKADAAKDIPRAEADATTTITEAENYARTVRDIAAGQAQAFLDLVAEYHKSPSVVAARLYRETVEEIGQRVRLTGVPPDASLILDFPPPAPEPPATGGAAPGAAPGPQQPR